MSFKHLKYVEYALLIIEHSILHKSRLKLLNLQGSCLPASSNFARYLKPGGRQFSAGTASLLLSDIIFLEFPDISHLSSVIEIYVEKCRFFGSFIFSYIDGQVIEIKCGQM